MKKLFRLLLPNQPSSLITIRSDFDSGNIEKAELGINNMIVLTPAHDCSGTIFESHAKGWFYFAVKGVSTHSKQKFVVKRMTQLSTQVI